MPHLRCGLFTGIFLSRMFDCLVPLPKKLEFDGKGWLDKVAFRSGYSGVDRTRHPYSRLNLHKRHLKRNVEFLAQ